MTSTQSPWTRLLAMCSTVMFTLLLAACGGSGAGGSGSTKGPGGVDEPVATNAARMSLITSETSLGSDGKKSAILTAIVKDKDNVALPDQTVTFSTADNGVTLEVGNSVSDATGRVEAVLSVTDRSLRKIKVLAKTGLLESSVTVPVVGTVLQINGSSTIVFNDSTPYSLSLRDSGGNPIIGAEYTVTSSQGNTIESTADDGSFVTDAQGQAVFNVIGVKAGADVLTVTSLGATTTFATSVSSTQLTYLAPAANAELTVDTPATVSAQLVESGTPKSGQTIRFTITRGSFVGADSATTDANGTASVQITSPNAGITTITATEVVGGASSGVTATRQAEFVSKLPSKIELQASPTVVGANLSAEGTNSSQLIAVVRDANDNPVKNARVDFTALADPSNGRLEPAFGITDSFGIATASFIAGPAATGFNAVQLQAKLSENAAVAATARLTVSELELSVRIGTGNELVDDGSLTIYRMPWTAIVADSAGNPVSNALVTVALQSVSYYKGEWSLAGGTEWVQTTTALCASEDDNLNGRLDGDEDLAISEGNGNGELDPGAVAISRVLASNSRTDEDGLAEIEVVYPKTYGRWVAVKMQVTITTVSGTEASADQEFILPMLAADVANPAVIPPGSRSPTGPFGKSGNCTDTL